MQPCITSESCATLDEATYHPHGTDDNQVSGNETLTSGTIAAMESRPFVRAIRDTPGGHYSAPGVITTDGGPYSPPIAV